MSKIETLGWVEIDDTPNTRAAGDKPVMRIRGYGAVFNSRSETMGRIVETIDRRAFDNTLAKNPDVRLLIEHQGLALARTANNTLRISTDDVGLRFEADLNPADPDAKRLYAKIERGDVTQMSFGFTIDEYTELESSDDAIRVHVQRVGKLYELSAVSFPAYPDSQVEIESVDDVDEINALDHEDRSFEVDLLRRRLGL